MKLRNFRFQGAGLKTKRLCGIDPKRGIFIVDPGKLFIALRTPSGKPAVPRGSRTGNPPARSALVVLTFETCLILGV
jgi:hypothetical protein